MLNILTALLLKSRFKTFFYELGLKMIQENWQIGLNPSEVEVLTTIEQNCSIDSVLERTMIASSNSHFNILTVTLIYSSSNVLHSSTNFIKQFTH